MAKLLKSDRPRQNQTQFSPLNTPCTGCQKFNFWEKILKICFLYWNQKLLKKLQSWSYKWCVMIKLWKFKYWIYFGHLQILWFFWKIYNLHLVQIHIELKWILSKALGHVTLRLSTNIAAFFPFCQYVKGLILSLIVTKKWQSLQNYKFQNQFY